MCDVHVKEAMSALDTLLVPLTDKGLMSRLV